MNQLTGRPKLLKQANLALIRRTIRAMGTATRAEIAEQTKISSTTVRSLLNEMLEDGEIESIGYDESSGGRKAERYGLKPDRYYSAAICISGRKINALLINICGEIVEITSLEDKDEDYEQAVFAYLDELTARLEIRAIGMGVPGVVEGSGYWREDPVSREFYKKDIGTILSGRYQVPVILENDLNAITIGFGKCYEKEYGNNKSEDVNIVYIHFEEGCVSAGIIAGGRIIRGYNNFAGELGLVLDEDDKLLDACMAEQMDDIRYTKKLVKILSWICGMLNPQYIALGGPDLRPGCIGAAESLLASVLPERMMAEILYAEDIWHDYLNGMAFLTAGKMFDEVQLIKE